MRAKLEANDLKGKIVKVPDVDKSVAVEALEQTDITPFEIYFNTAKELVEDSEGIRWYMSADTYGDNWRVSDECTTNILAIDKEHLGYARVFVTDDYTFFRAMRNKKDYVFDFTSPFSAYYKVCVNILMGKAGGYVNIYLNDVLVGSKIDTYSATESLINIKLGTHKLKAGRYANKIKIVPTTVSGGSKYYPSFTGFSFKVV